jgi:hypothetical protein
MTLKIVENTLFLVGGKKKRKILGYFMGPSYAATHRSITLHLHRKNKGFKKGNPKKTG